LTWFEVYVLASLAAIFVLVGAATKLLVQLVNNAAVLGGQIESLGFTLDALRDSLGRIEVDVDLLVPNLPEEEDPLI